MNRNHLILLAVGIGIGYVIGSVVTKNRYGSFNEHPNYDEGEWPDDEELYPDPDANVEQEKVPGQVKNVVDYRDKYKNEARRYSREEQPEDIVDSPVYEQVNDDKDDSGPRAISINQFSEENQDYEKLTVHYYIGDDTLVDENEEILPESMEIIGYRIEHYFKHGDKVVYVRNDRVSTDYEVIRIDGNYSDMREGR